MATITGLTADRMLEIEGSSIVDGEIRPDGHLWLIQHDGDEIDAGPVLGPQGPVGPQGPSAVASIPGEVKLWPGGTLPLMATYGRWVWADGAVYPVASHPIAAGHIATQWRTFAGASDPGGSNFRVPDLRGVVPVGMDAMPGGTRANRMTRAVAITIAAKTGEETHIITLPEMAAHAHGINDPGHSHSYWMSNADSVSAYAVPDGYSDNWQITAPTLPATTGITIQNAGGNGAHENVQPSVFVPYIVRLDG